MKNDEIIRSKQKKRRIGPQRFKNRLEGTDIDQVDRSANYVNAAAPAPPREALPRVSQY